MNPHCHPPAAPCRGDRRGMTLVELLVVTGLMAVFLGLVVTGVRGRRARKGGAETLAAVLSAAQARALGVPEGAAAILAPDPAAAAVCTSLYDADMQPLIEATVTGVPPSPPSTVTANATVTPTNGGDVDRAYKILLFGGRDSPAISPPTAWLAFKPPGTVSFRTTLGQSTSNTVWPKAPGGGAFNAVLAQYPQKSSSLVELDEGSAVDLSFSGIGDERSTDYGRLDRNRDGTSKGAIALVFDRAGRVAEVIQQVPDPGQPAAAGAAQPAMPVGAIYFLVAPRDVIASGSNTLAEADAAWVTLEPQTGRVFVADNVVQSGTDTAALRAARAKARQGIGMGK